MVVESVEPGCWFTNSFIVIRTHKDDKNRQNTLFLCYKRMNLVGNKQLLVIAPFQLSKYREKEFCVYLPTKYKRLLEMCIVQHVEIRSLFTFQPKK